jgi:CMP-N,N'-diacetyllegionaminic acid synthase
MQLIAIIPARGGSKGIRNKNMQLLANKPLVLHAVDCAIESKIFDRIIVSSDDDAILACVKSRSQADVPFKRPDHLAQDDTRIADVIHHLLTHLQREESFAPHAFMLLEPTSPLRTPDDLYMAYKHFQKMKKPCLLSVSEPMQHPSNMILARRKHSTTWQYCLDRPFESRGRQDFNPVWFINGLCYITNTKFFLTTQMIYDLNRCALFEVPSERAIDINTPMDLRYARSIMDCRV